MIVADLKASCLKTDPLSGKPVTTIYLNLPRKHLPKHGTTRVRLVPTGGPTGEIMSVKPNDDKDGYWYIGRFYTKAILTFLDREKESL